MAGRVTLIGRERETGHITAVVDRVAGGQGRVVFLTGEPGIGKTRFAEWTLEAASGRAFRVLQGTAFPLERNLPYALLIAAFGPATAGLWTKAIASRSRASGYSRAMSRVPSSKTPQRYSRPA